MKRFCSQGTIGTHQRTINKIIDGMDESCFWQSKASNEHEIKTIVLDVRNSIYNVKIYEEDVCYCKYNYIYYFIIKSYILFFQGEYDH